MLFQLTRLFQFRVHESSITYTILDSCDLIWNKIANWNDMEKHTLFQLETLAVIAFIIYHLIAIKYNN